MKDKKILLMVAILILVFMIIVGGTYAYFSWESSSEQVTNVVVNVPNICTISVDGGGVVDSSSVLVMPSTCTNTKNAIIKEVNVDVENVDTDQSIYLDLWLDINNLASELRTSNNFKYALTDSPTSCVDGEIFSGSFKGLTTGNKVRIFRKTYSGFPSATYSETYYLYIWLDAVETSLDTAGKNFELSLNGNCSNWVDEIPPTTEILSTNNVSNTQTVTLNISDDNEIQAYYFGTSNPNTNEVDWIVVNSTEDINETVSVTSPGTYYLAAKDDLDNETIINKTFYETTLSVTNGGVTPNSVITMSGNTFILPEPTPMANYTFDGWYMASDYSGNAITSYTPSSNVTIYGKMISNAMPVVIPIANNYCKSGLTYTGSSQILTNNPGEGYTFRGNTGTNVGSYMVTATLNEGYIWSDETVEDKTFSCSISKASSTLTVSDTNMTIIYAGSGTESFTYTYDGDGTVSCSSSNTSVATCSVDTANKKVTVTAKAKGNFTITVSATEGTNYNAPSPVTVYFTAKLATYTISYDACGGSGAPSSQTKTYGETLTLSSTIPTKDGNVFEGWSTIGCEASAIYEPGAPYTTNADATLYAIWRGALIPTFTYTGTYEIVDDDDNVISNPSTYLGNWKIRFLTDGMLIFTELNSAANGIDLFLVGGGGNGARGGTYLATGSKGGGGGGGGASITVVNLPIITNVSYTIDIGAANTNTWVGVDTVAYFTALAGSTPEKPSYVNNSVGWVQPIGEGGVGRLSSEIDNYGAGNVIVNSGSSGDGSSGTYEFNGLSGKKYGAGGGLGTGGVSTYVGGKAETGEIGGFDGGGQGGDGCSYLNKGTGFQTYGGYSGNAAVNNTGAGGGGGGGSCGYNDTSYGSVGSGGAGASGIVIIRNTR